MKQVIVKYRNRTKSVKTPVKNQLTWYDPIKKEMLYFEGGQLEFEYKEDEYLIKMDASERLRLGIKSTFRLLPKVTELKSITRQKVLDNNMFEKFLSNYLNYNNSQISTSSKEKDYIVCNVSNNELDDFTYQLHRQGFEYQIL